MARKSHRVAPPIPNLAIGAEDTLAYYTKAPSAGCKLRDISPIEQMYGYYTAE